MPQPQVLGVPVSALTFEQALSVIETWIAQKERKYVCTLDVHALMEGYSQPDIRRIYENAGMVVPDGMPLVWLLRRRGYLSADRICGPDLMPALFRRSEQHGYRHFLYGSSDSTLSLLQRNLAQSYPAARLVGHYSPPFRPLTPDEERDVDKLINTSDPDIVWVGLGAPKQDRWMAAHRATLSASVLIGVGAAFDMLAGTVTRAPKFLRQTGFEWMFRVVQEPRRLTTRYLHSNSRFVLTLMAEKMRRNAPSGRQSFP